MVAAGRVSVDDVAEAWAVVDTISVRLHSLERGPHVVAVALRLGRQNAYDAAYIVLALQLGANLWTLDGPLARNAAGVGLPVRLIE
jgi:predicted nucleic acid-binding protein